MLQLLAAVRNKGPTYFSFALSQPGWIVMFALARVSLIRRMLWARTGNADASPQTALTAADAHQIIDDLRQEGLYCGLRLPRDLAEDIRSFAMQTPCYANKRRDISFLPDDIDAVADACGIPILTGHYLDKIEECSAIRRVIDDPLLATVARGYLGGNPNLTRLRLWWSFPAAEAEALDRRMAAQDHFHYDLGDWREVRFFFYLTPVDSDSGPHVYVRRSHRRHSLADQLSPTLGRPNDRIVRTYGAGNVTQIHGETGDGFIEDPYGFHMARSVSINRRLMLEIGFGPSHPSRIRLYDERVR